MDNQIPLNDEIGDHQGSPLQPPDDPKPTKRPNLSPPYMLALTLAGIFLAEVVAMIVISFLEELNYGWQTMIDALIMVAIVYPFLYYLSFRPLLVTLRQREQALAELRQLQVELEQRVEQRTVDLNQAMRSLEVEIAERKRSEERNAYQARLLDNVNDAIVASDEQYRLTAWNAAAEALYGWQAEEVLGQNGVEILHTDFLIADPEQMRREINEMGRWRGEANQLRKDGMRIPVEMASIVLRDDDGQITGYVSVNRDIAERKRTEAALRESEQKYSAIFDNSPLAIALSRMPELTLVSANQTFLALFEYTRDEAIGRTSVELGIVDPDSQKPVAAELQAHGFVRNFEVVRTTRSGSQRGLSLNLDWITIDNQKYILTTINDITELKQAEAEIRGLARFPEENPNPVLRVDLDGILLYANPASAELLQWWQCAVGGRLPAAWSQIALEVMDLGRAREEELMCDERIYLMTFTPILESGYVNIYGREITARKQVEEALRQSEERFAKAFRSSPVPVCILNLDDWRFVEVNDSFLKLFGYTREELVGRSSIEELYIDPGERAWLTQRLLEQQPVRNHETISRTKNGDLINMLYSTDVILLDGKAHVLAILHDITERKRIEQAILQAKREWERTFDAVPDLITILDEQQNIVRLNRAMADRIGRTPQECIGLKCFEIVHGLSCAPFFCPHVLTCQDGKTHQAEVHEPRLGGDFMVSTTPLIDPGGKLVATVHVARDITERKRAEQALREAHAELELRVQQRTAELALANTALERTNQDLVAEMAERERATAELRLASAALEAAANGIFITGRNGDIRWINPAFTGMTGYSRDEVIGQNPRFLKSGKHLPEYYRKMWGTILSGQVWHGETINKRKDGSLYIEEQTITPIIDSHSKITNFIAIKQDVTERIQAQQKLVKTSELLERYFSSIDTLIAYMDRDFNFIRVNEAYAKSAGYPVEYFLGKNHFALYPHAENLAIFQQVVDTGEPYTVFEKPFDYPDHPEWGVTYWDWSLQSVKGQDGDVEGLVLSLVDVTGRKRAELELAAQNQELRTLSLVEHELREFAESLAQSAIILNASLELQQVLVTILEQIQRTVPYTAANILLKEGDLFSVACFLTDREMGETGPTTGMTYSLEDFPLINRMFSTLQPLLMADLSGDEDWQRAAGLEWVRSYMGAPLVAAGQVFGIINLHSDRLGAFDPKALERLMAYTAPAAAAMENAWLFEQVRSSREHLQALSRRLVEVQEGERRYIASELHDEVGQALTGLTLGLQLVEKKAEDPQAVRAEVAEMNYLVVSVLEDLHRLAMDLRPTSLDHLGLAAALRQHVAMIKDKHGLEAQFEMVGVHDRLPSELETAFYRIVQEGLNNVVRHAKAKSVDVVLEQPGDKLVLLIEDDGIGFDPETVLKQGERLGLFGMRERAEMLGGNLTIESTPGKGTTLVVEVPYGNPHPDR